MLIYNHQIHLWLRTFVKPIVIQLGDDYKVTVSHNGLVNYSQNYEVSTLCTPTFRLSPPSINQLDTAGYTSTFGRDKCSISSPSITIAGNQYRECLRRPRPEGARGREKEHHRVYISPEWVPLSAQFTIPFIAHFTQLTSSPPHTASPCATSTVPQCPPATEFPKPTQKPLTIPEPWLWHRRLAHIHPTALRSLIDGYTKADSMCTACIQAQHKQKIIIVKTKSTTKQLELMCGPFSTPTCASHHYYILFIDGYIHYTFVWVLPDTKSKTCTSAYHADIREEEKDSGYILAHSPSHSDHHTSCGKTGRVDIRCGSAERTGQKERRVYPHNWVDQREDRHRSLKTRNRLSSLHTTTPLSIFTTTLHSLTRPKHT